jgi:hypothetical protein
MKWSLLLLISLFSFQVCAEDCLIFRKEQIKICIGDKVRFLPSHGRPMVEVMGFSRGDPQGKVLILKTGRSFKKPKYHTKESRTICTGCEPAGLDQIRVGPDNQLDSDEIITPDRSF